MIAHRIPAPSGHFGTRRAIVAAIAVSIACAAVPVEADTVPSRGHRAGMDGDLAPPVMPDARSSAGDSRLQTAAGRVAMTAPAATIASVTTCADAGPGSLRAAVATHAAVIDMTALACSTISLTTGQISIDNTVPNITFNGPTAHVLTIDAGNLDRVLYHGGTGLLTIDHVNLSNGSTGAGNLLAGCILAFGSMKLQNSTISNCTVTNTQGFATKGGAIFLFHDLTLNDSVVSGSVSQSTGHAYGGGAFVGGKLVMTRSAIRGNTASAPDAEGGGAYVLGDAQLYAATVSGNIAGYEGGLAVKGSATIHNSTISTNSASLVGGLYTGGLLVLDNSTVTLNTHTSIKFGAGVYANAGMIAHSSIVANNMCSTSGQHCEVQCSSCLVTGSNNLIMGANGALPPDTIVVDPVLGPLADNGGPTRTHALLGGSPAINNGSNIHDFPLDQRGHPRSVGTGPDIGAFESAPNLIFADGFE